MSAGITYLIIAAELVYLRIREGYTCSIISRMKPRMPESSATP